MNTSIDARAHTSDLFRRRVTHTKAAHPLSGAVTVAAALMMLAAPAHASVTPGEQFIYNWTETSGSNIGLTGTADFTLGAAATTPGFFTLSSFSVTQNGGFCGICSPLTENLSGGLFDAATLGVVGDITGSYLNSRNRTHTFDLLTADFPAGTWTFSDTGPGGVTQTSMGSYRTTLSVTSVPEPATLGLLCLGLGGLGLFRRRLMRRQ